MTPTQISHYRIASQLGAGGMGEVYRARDTRLDREVAIKVLPAAFAKDADRLRRFEQEARATSALNHANILTIHDIGTHEGAPFIVAELLEGEELRAQLSDGALPVRKVLDYARQIADGLAAAHAKGVVHRDLKPENLFVTSDGHIKILDFGLAKLRPQPHGGSDLNAPTQTRITEPSVVMGTVGYMSPEQVRGQETDHRSDIFSFGVILYEMLSGQRAFHGDSAIEVMNAILKEEPLEFSETNVKVNPQLEKIVRRCLEKKPERRFQTASDLGFALEALSTPSDTRLEPALPALEPRNTDSRLSRRERWLIAAAIACLLGLVAAFPFAVSHLREAPASTRALKFSVLLPEKATIGGNSIPLAISPDGQRLAFIATHEGNQAVWVRSLDSLSAQPLAGTEGAAASIFWSPDGRFIAFFTNGKLKKVNVSGGLTQTICDEAEPRGGAWNRDDVIIFATNSGPLLRVPASGGKPVAVTKLDEAHSDETHRWPCFLPDGRHFIYFARGDQPEHTGIYIGSLDSMEPRRLLEAPTSAVYASPGYLLFVRPQAKRQVDAAMLLAQPFDADNLEVKGEPIPLGDQVAYNLGLGRTGVSASENGTLAFVSAGYGANLPIWFDRNGKQLEKLDALGTAGTYFSFSLSRDKRRAAIDRIDPQTGTSDIWLVDLASRIPSRFTMHPAYDRFPLWSPDSSRIVFASSREGGYNFYIKNANATGNEELLLKLDRFSIPDDWSPDGRFIVYENSGSKTRRDLWLLLLAGDRQPTPFLQSEFNEQHAHFSPDGKWIAYSSDESGTAEVYVQSFPASGGKKRISTNGGIEPRWRQDGKELYYVSGKKLMAAAVNSGVQFEANAPRALFDQGTTTLMGAAYRSSFAVTPDGQRFLIKAVVDETGSAPISVVTNWTTGLRK